MSEKDILDGYNYGIDLAERIVEDYLVRAKALMKRQGIPLEGGNLQCVFSNLINIQGEIFKVKNIDSTKMIDALTDLISPKGAAPKIKIKD